MTEFFGAKAIQGSASEAGKRFSDFSVVASSVVRPLAIAGIAIVWLFANSGDNKEFISSLSKITDDRALFYATALFILVLFLDVLQYALSAYLWSKTELVLSAIGDFDNFDVLFPDKLVQRGWSSWIGLDLSQHINSVASVVLDDPRLKNDPPTNAHGVARARSLLKDAELADAAQRKWAGTDQAFERLRAELGRAWAPPRVTKSSVFLFWSKLLLLLLAYTLLFVALILAK